MKINNLVAELAKQNLTNDEILWYKFCESFNLDCDLIENRFFKINDEDHYYKILGMCWKSNHEIEDGSDFLKNELIIHYKKFKIQKCEIKIGNVSISGEIKEIKINDNLTVLNNSINSSLISTIAPAQMISSTTTTFNNYFNDISEKIDSLNSNNKLKEHDNYMTFDELFQNFYPENNKDYIWPEIKSQKFKIIMI